MGENAETVRRAVELFNEGKIPEVMAMYHPDVEVEATGTIMGGAFKGRQGLAEWFRKIGATYPTGVHLDIESLVESGNTVVLEWNAKGTLANGKAIEGRAANIVEFRDGKPFRHRMYDDSEQLARMMERL